MGIVAYFARMNCEQLRMLRDDSHKLWGLGDNPDFPGAALTNLDRDWEILSWLLSSKKREEQKHQTVTAAVMRRDNARELMNDDAAWAAAVQEEQERLGIEVREPEELPSDPLLTAIEGRCSEGHRVSEIDFGYGGACFFSTDDVRQLALALSSVGTEELRVHFDPEMMQKFDVGGVSWLSEPASVLEEFILPRLKCLKDFYANAANGGQCVLVAYA